MEHYSKEYIECKDISVKKVSQLLKDIIVTANNERNECKDPKYIFCRPPYRFEYHLYNLERSHVPEIHVIHLAARKISPWFTYDDRYKDYFDIKCWKADSKYHPKVLPKVIKLYTIYRELAKKAIKGVHY